MICELVILPYRQPARIFAGKVSESRKASWKTSVILSQGKHQGLSQRKTEKLRNRKALQRNKPQDRTQNE